MVSRLREWALGGAMRWAFIFYFPALGHAGRKRGGARVQMRNDTMLPMKRHLSGARFSQAPAQAARAGSRRTHCSKQRFGATRIAMTTVQWSSQSLVAPEFLRENRPFCRLPVPSPAPRITLSGASRALHRHGVLRGPASRTQRRSRKDSCQTRLR